jgi:hypothetical protein
VHVGLTPLAGGVENPISSADQARVGGPQPFYGPYATLRIDLNHSFAFETSLRAYFFEKVYGYESVDFRGTPSRVEYQTTTLFFDGGLRWWMF